MLVGAMAVKKTLAWGVVLLLVTMTGWMLRQQLRPEGVTPTYGVAHVAPPESGAVIADLAAPPAGATARTGARGTPQAKGRVVDVEGRPVPEARIASWRDDVEVVIDPVAAGEADVSSTITDAMGAFTVALPADAPAFVLLATAARFAPTSVAGVQAGDDVTIVLPRSESIRGTVRDLDDQPISGARLTWTGFVGNARATATAVSAADGTYRLGGLTPVRGFIENLQESLEVTADGFAPVRLPRARAGSVPTGGATPRLGTWDVWLGRGAIVRGRVVDIASGQPVREARVVLWSEQEVMGLTLTDGRGIQNPGYYSALGDVRTSEDGAFTMANVPAWGVHRTGVHTGSPSARRLGRVGVIASGYAIETREMRVPAESEVVELELRVTTSGTVRGRVVRSNGEPVSGAHVSWTLSEADGARGWIPPVFAGLDAAPSTTDSEGRYTLALVSARGDDTPPIHVVAAPPGSSPWALRASVSVIPRAGATVEAPDLTLGSDDPEGMSALVTVVDETGQPVAGATFEDCLPGARTNDVGRARLYFHPYGTPRPRDATVRVHAPGRERVTTPNIPLAPGTVADVRVALGPRRPPTSVAVVAAPADLTAHVRGYVVEGTICDARTGRPSLNWDVSLGGSGDTRPTARPVGPGRFRLEDVPAGTWSLNVRAEGYEPEKRERIRVGPDSPISPIDVRLVAGIVLRGRVLDESGVPLDGARVFFNGQQVPSVDGETATDGRFAVRGFRAGGRYSVWVARADGRGGMSYWVRRPFDDLHVDADVTADREITVGTAGGVRLVVQSPALGNAATLATDAHVAAGAATVLTFEDALRTTSWTSVGIWGRQREIVLPVGRWTVRVEVPGSSAREVDVVIQPGASIETSIDIP